MDQRLLDYNPVLEAFGADELFGEAAAHEALESPLDETLESMLAAELLSVRNELGLRQCIARLIKAVGSPSDLPDGAARVRALTDVLAEAARPLLLPLLQSIGAAPALAQLRAVRAPKLVSRAAELFGLELEGLSQEDKEFALARQFVRLGVAAALRAASLRDEPRAAAAQALHSAALEHAPGLPGYTATEPSGNGRWIRRGDQIVVFDA